MFVVEVPNHCPKEIEWISRFVFKDLLGLEYVVEAKKTDKYSIKYDGKMLSFPDVFFNRAATSWLDPESIPRQSLVLWENFSTFIEKKLIHNRLPVFFGTPSLEHKERSAHLGIDVLGSCFFMLSRYEEAIIADRDMHDRFPSSASTALQGEFLCRPLVDEYVETLWGVMKQLWPRVERSSRHPRTFISCDIDRAYSGGAYSLRKTVREIGSDLLHRSSISLASIRFLNFLGTSFGSQRFDPMNTFDWIMDVNEAAGNRVAFYFLVSGSEPEKEGFYDIDEPRIRKLMRRIHSRGHEIGLHSSYFTYKDADRTMKEMQLLQKVMDEESIRQEEIGNRQHYLRWSTPETARNLDSAGVAYDSTIGFADRPGFRCGTCHEFPMYDLVDRRPLRLRQRPLVVMEGSVLDVENMGLGYTEEALDKMRLLKELCRKVRGDFTLLWHNSHFLNPQDRLFYRELIQ